jgi:hypothetical protein
VRLAITRNGEFVFAEFWTVEEDRDECLPVARIALPVAEAESLGATLLMPEQTGEVALSDQPNLDLLALRVGSTVGAASVSMGEVPEGRAG